MLAILKQTKSLNLVFRKATFHTEVPKFLIAQTMATNRQETGTTPTGCFKCGRPGHWSRDCPVKSADGPLVGGGSSTVQGGSARGAEKGAHGGGDRVATKGSLKWKVSGGSAAEEAVGKAPKKRPQLTPDLLLSDNGLGYLLEKMPQMVKIRGEGREVHDLKSLLEGYVQWHSQLHSYLGFNDFVAKVEELGATKRIRMCVRELREKVGSGFVPDVNQEGDREKISHAVARPSSERATTGDTGREPDEWLGADSNEVDDIDANTDPAVPVNEDEFEAFFRQGTTQSNETPVSDSLQPNRESRADASPIRKLPSPLDEDKSPAAPSPVTINETLAARMQANRLKALERAEARRATNASV